MLLTITLSQAGSVSGAIEQNTVWTADKNPIIVSGNIEVPESLSLKIEAGVVVKFDGYFHILVRGALTVTGTQDNQVLFTSNKEKPATDDWNGLIFYGEKCNSTLSYCTIKYAFKNLAWKSSPVIQNCTFTSNNYALYCSFSNSAKILSNIMEKNQFGVYCDFSSPLIQKNKITNNNYGIYCILSSAPIVGENTINSNTEKDIYLDESMGKNKSENINNHVWDLMKGLF